MHMLCITGNIVQIDKKIVVAESIQSSQLSV